MKEIILATHGRLSEEFKRTIEIIVGKTENIRCFCMTKEKSEDVGKTELSKLVSNSDEKNLVVLTDLFGGSAANICAELLMRGHKFRLITGLNLPMLLTIITADNDEISIDDLVNKALDASAERTINVSEMLLKEMD
jgi:mannose/fructose/sorbose-specific phosphotransferase system IIA component